MFLITLAALGATVLAADYVGPESCKSCHAQAYGAWKLSKHARALDSLSPAQQKDVGCLYCHAPDLADRGVSGISCETCHGGGQSYSPGYVMKDPELARLVGLEDPTEKSCRTCHDASSPSLKPFEFTDKLKLIEHWKPSREIREARKSTP